MPTSHVLPPALDVGSSAATEKVQQLSAQAALSKDFSERSCQGRVSESGAPSPAHWCHLTLLLVTAVEERAGRCLPIAVAKSQ